jgi:cobalt/nickel transport system ATP-binding protein
MFENVSFQYPDKNFKMQNLNMEILPGRKYAICGQNGSGKTTLLRLLMGLETVDNGTIIVDGLHLNKKNLKFIRQKLGFVFQNPDSQVFSASVFEDVAFGPRNMGFTSEEVENHVQGALEKVNMLEYRDRSPYLLSYGQKKRIAIAGVLAMDPSIIILDEPFTNLDFPSRISLMQLLDYEVRDRGKTIIFATHSRKFIQEWSNFAFLLDQGNILFKGEIVDLNKFHKSDLLLGPL